MRQRIGIKNMLRRAVFPRSSPNPESVFAPRRPAQSSPPKTKKTAASVSSVALENSFSDATFMGINPFPTKTGISFYRIGASSRAFW
jgi:hypothetical protein